MSEGVSATSMPAARKAAILPRGCSLASAHDRSGVTHTSSLGGGGPGDESGDRLLAMPGGPGGGLLLGGAADLADHDDRLGFGVLVEHLQNVEVGGAVDRVAADADAGALAVAAGGELPDGLVGEGAGARDDADVSLPVDVAGGDADAAPAVGLLAGAGCDKTGAVRADEAGLGALHRVLHPHHVDDGDALGDADHEIESRLDPSRIASAANGGGTKMAETVAPVSRTAWSTVSKMGTCPRTSAPLCPG